MRVTLSKHLARKFLPLLFNFMKHLSLETLTNTYSIYNSDTLNALSRSILLVNLSLAEQLLHLWLPPFCMPALYVYAECVSFHVILKLEKFTQVQYFEFHTHTHTTRRRERKKTANFAQSMSMFARISIVSLNYVRKFLVLTWDFAFPHQYRHIVFTNMNNAHKKRQTESERNRRKETIATRMKQKSVV